MENIHTYRKNGSELNLRAMLQGTPCEKEMTAKDEASIEMNINIALGSLNDKCGFVMVSELETAYEMLTAEIRKAAPKYMSGRSSVRTFMARVLYKAKLKCLAHFSAKCRATHSLVGTATEGGKEEYKDAIDDSEYDPCAPDLAEAALRRIDLVAAFKEAYKEPDLVLLMNALVESNGKRSGISEKLGWSDHKFRQNLGRLKELFKDFL